MKAGVPRTKELMGLFRSDGKRPDGWMNGWAGGWTGRQMEGDRNNQIKAHGQKAIESER